MKIFACKVCGHIEFNEAPGKCPICGSPKSKYAENPAAIKRPGDPSNKYETEQKHIPSLNVVKSCGLMGEGCTDVNVKIGEITHPMEEKHFIQYVDFYLDAKFISRMNFSPLVMNPAACLHLKANKGKVVALENCNVHGNWMKEIEL